jgi:hypothetical protein
MIYDCGVYNSSGIIKCIDVGKQLYCRDKVEPLLVIGFYTMK